MASRVPPWADPRLRAQVDQLKLKVSRLEEECALLRRARGPLPGAEEKEKEPDSADLVSELRAENQRLTAALQELQEGRQQVPGWCWVAGVGPSLLLTPPPEARGSEIWLEPCWPLVLRPE